MNYNSKINRQRRFNARTAEVEHENEKFRSLSEGQTPMNVHQDIEGVLGNIANHVSPVAEESPRNKVLLNQAKTAVMVKCFCPRCVIGHRSHVSHQVFDVQHHVAAANGVMSDDQFDPDTRRQPKVVDPALKAAYFAGYPTIHSPELESKQENTESDLTVMHNPNLDYTWHAEDPEHGHVQKRAKIAAEHYLGGCHHACGPKCTGGDSCKSDCDTGCKGSYKDQGMSAPSEDAQYLLGLKKGHGGAWHYDAARSKIANVPTLAHYASIKVTPNDVAAGDEVKKNLTVGHYLQNPETKIGKDSKGKDLLAGQYITSTGPRFGRPMQKLGFLKTVQHIAYDQLLSKGEKSVKPYWDAMKGLTHLAHGQTIGTDDIREGRVSDLGKRGLMTPHRLWWPSRNSKKYLAHAERGRRDNENEMYSGIDVDIPVNTPQLDLKSLSDSSTPVRRYWED